MRKVEFTVGGHLMRAKDAAVILADEEPLAALIEQVVQTISTDVEVTCGGVTMHFAAWQDPDHWSQEWEEKGISPDDVAALVEAHVREDNPRRD